MKTLILLTVIFVTSRIFADDTNAIYQIDFQQLIGKPVDSPEVKGFLSHFSYKPYQYVSHPGLIYEFKQEGISLDITEPNVYYVTEPTNISRYLAVKPETFALTNIDDREDVLINVTFYSQGSNGYDQYAGPLPYGLKFTMTRGEVEQMLGSPKVDPGLEWLANYPKLKFCIAYEKDSAPSNPENERIQSIRVY